MATFRTSLYEFLTLNDTIKSSLRECNAKYPTVRRSQFFVSSYCFWVAKPFNLVSAFE
jgi:hypothetical protein